MIKFEPLSASAIKIVPSDKLTVADFRLLGPQVDAMLDRSDRIRLLVDASRFEGWESFKAFELHSGFVKIHQRYVERLALVVGQGWPEWLVETIRMFLHRDGKAFELASEAEAVQFILEG